MFEHVCSILAIDTFVWHLRLNIRLELCWGFHWGCEPSFTFTLIDPNEANWEIIGIKHKRYSSTWSLDARMKRWALGFGKFYSQTCRIKPWQTREFEAAVSIISRLLSLHIKGELNIQLAYQGIVVMSRDDGESHERHQALINADGPAFLSPLELQREDEAWVGNNDEKREGDFRENGFMTSRY